MRYYCIHCRKITNTENFQKVIRQKSSMFKGICAECGKVKTQFTSNNQWKIKLKQNTKK